MHTSTISRSDIPQFSAFSQAFGNQEPFASFLHRPFTHLSDLQLQAEEKFKTYSPEKRSVLVAVLKNQLNNKTSVSQQKSLDLLVESSTFTITTGHQLTLFGGPMYLVYKVLHVVKLAQDFNATNSGRKAVPVFWMASEDHDLDEVRSTHLFNQKLTWETVQKGAVGRMNTSDFSDVLAQFSGLFEGKETIIQDLLKVPVAENYTDYLQAFLTVLFAEFGVLVLNPDVKELKELFIPVIERELLDQVSFPAVELTNELLIQKGLKPQAQAREINLFLLSEGQRTRIEKTESGYSVGSKPFSTEELLALMNNFPEQFSPNVILRPVYQETILPNLAYIGGGGEMAYWIQLKGVFAAHGVLFPLIQQRNSVHIIDGGTAKRIEKAGFDILRYFEPKENLRKEYLAENDGDSMDTTVIQKQLALLQQAMLSKSVEIDASLQSFTEAETVRLAKQVEQFEQRLIKHVKLQHEGALKAIDFVCERFIPENELQERYFHWLNFAPTGDYTQLLNDIYQTMDPFCGDLIVLNL